MPYAREQPFLPIILKNLQLAADEFISELALSLVYNYGTVALNTLRQKKN